MAAANSPVLATSELGSARALNTLAIFAENAKDLESYLKHAVVASKLGTTIILEAAPSATQSQAVHNLSTNEKGPIKMKVPEAKVLLDDACKANANLTYQMETGVYSTNVDGLLAVKAFAEIWKEYDGAAAEIKSMVKMSVGKSAARPKVARPFDSYSGTVEDKIGANQRASTLNFEAWLKDSITLPSTAELVKKVEVALGLDDPQVATLKQAHLLRYPTKSGSLFKMHTDHTDYPAAQAPHITANILLSPSNVSEFQVAGYEPFRYGGPGSVAAFPSGLYHASGRCDARKVLLVLMWRLTNRSADALTINVSDPVDAKAVSGSIAGSAVDEAKNESSIGTPLTSNEPSVEPLPAGDKADNDQAKTDPATVEELKPEAAATAPPSGQNGETANPTATLTELTASSSIDGAAQAKKDQEEVADPPSTTDQSPDQSNDPIVAASGAATLPAAAPVPKKKIEAKKAAVDPSGSPVKTGVGLSPPRPTRSSGAKGTGGPDADANEKPAAAPAASPAGNSSKRAVASGPKEAKKAQKL